MTPTPRALCITLTAAAALIALPAAPTAAATATVTNHAQAAGVYDGTTRPTWSACETPGGLLYVGFHQKSSRVYQAQADGTYANVTPAGAWPLVSAKVAPDRHGCAWADFDGNGVLDMANSTGRNQSNFVKPANRDNELWLGQPDGTYVERGTESGIADPCTRGRHMAAGDFTGDGLPDLFVGAATGRSVDDPCDAQPGSEQPHLFANLGDADGDGQWDGMALAQSFGDDDPGQRCAEAYDANGDGALDLLGCRLKSKAPNLYLNAAGSLVRQTATASGLTAAVEDATPYDMDADGDLDLVQIRKTSCGWQPNDGNGKYGTYRTIMTLASEGRSVAVGQAAAGLAVYCQTQAASSNPTDYVGVLSGATWAKYPVPDAAGLADEVYAVHPSGPGGPAEFLVLNGGNGGEAGTGGPIQLIAVGP